MDLLEWLLPAMETGTAAPTPPDGWLLDSLIVSDCPLIEQEFPGKDAKLLWRGSRDGFGVREFHRRCDGRANTLTLIADTDGNVFGGFTPLAWESRTPRSFRDNSNCYKCDDSLQSFLFTLRNPHGVPPRKFALRAEKKEKAIYCWSAWGAVFGSDIAVADSCNANTHSFSHLGTRYGDGTYANDTAFDYFFTRGERFTVKEIEVFEIAD
jgi:hypothetical protein